MGTRVHYPEEIKWKAIEMKQAGGNGACHRPKIIKICRKALRREISAGLFFFIYIMKKRKEKNKGENQYS
jgi:hypothetical protein